jgi:ribosomal protein L1
MRGDFEMTIAKPKKRGGKKERKQGQVKVTIEMGNVGFSKRQIADMAKAFRGTLVTTLEGTERTRDDIPKYNMPPQVIYKY